MIVCKQWFPVVPDTYLAAAMLLGCDVLKQAPLIWNGKKRVLMWGNTPYVVNHIPKQKPRVSRVKFDPVEILKPSKTFSQIHLLHHEKLPPYQTRFVSVMVNQSPGTTLMLHPQPRFSHSSYPFLVKVTSEGHVYIPLTNGSISDKIFKTGTILGLIEKAELIPSPQVHATTQIQHLVMGVTLYRFKRLPFGLNCSLAIFFTAYGIHPHSSCQTGMGEKLPG